MTEILRVDQPGLGVITDMGRCAPHLGQSRNGALDQASARLANALVSNSLDDAVIELVAMDSVFTVLSDCVVAITGATSTVTIDGRHHLTGEPLFVRSGEQLAITDIRDGMRVYLAVLGSFDVQRVLGSCAPDAYVGIGRGLQLGQVLGSGESLSVITPPKRPFIRIAAPSQAVHASQAKVEVTPGPQYDDFSSSLDAFYGSSYTVSAQSDHVGLRLRGYIPERASTAEILSAGTPIGAIEVTPGDELLALHRGRGVTAGYPIIAIATSRGLDILAQASPMAEVAFSLVDTAIAIAQRRADHSRLLHIRARAAAALAAHGVDCPMNSMKATP
ncbi:biotin-dependent carboxylase uncharacterized domain-containing protein [Arthrobacter sp. yr096]|uniref:5-oxoprolinase subunit C family protein n=1 Tax=Arthrobacter sp. yr096 TaxID=1761750 RepID=UPI0008BA0B44|nr:biotin-dependent carboxyltransferase family protein [Arthrobacter sp. yr096]SEJ77915.1 biotin-dependent carboxylase uncharacterized domain-containing protein [Arthrobacter sp. yr096]